MKRILKIIIRIILSFIGFVALYLLFAIAGAYITTNNEFKEATEGVEIFIISNGVHTDICIPFQNATKDWNNILSFNLFKSEVNPKGYLSCGWGDKGFYLETPTWDDLTFSTAAKAMFLPSPTAMHVTIYNSKPTCNNLIKSVIVSTEQFQLLEEYFYNHFNLHENKAQLIDCCRYPGFNDNFYEATGNYYLFRTCNNWANQALKYAKIKTAIWAPFDKGILRNF